MVQLNVLVVGSGLMGSQIGVEYALGGHTVTFLVRDERAARARVDEALATAARAGLSGAEPAIGYATEVRPADLVVESIPEDLALKREVLRPIAAALPEAIIASNTSSLRLTELGEAVGAPERTLGTHYWNPPLLMPPVEIVAGEATKPSVVERVRAVLEDLGKEPVLVERDVPGFLWNRLQAALLREALWLVENGVATPRAVDRVVRSGLARRYRYTGPFETVALGGVDAWQRVLANLFPALSSSTDPGGLERWLDYREEELAAAKARRDDGLADELERP